MGRRQAQVVTSAMDPKQARTAVARHFRKLTAGAGINMAEFRAQLHEEEMVEMIVDFAKDMTLPPTFRRECALDVVKFARGAIKIWAHDGQTIDPNAQGQTGNPIGAEIQAARLASEVYKQLDYNVRKHIPSAEWTEEVRQLAGDTLAFYAESDVEEC